MCAVSDKFNMITISILFLFLLLGVATPRHIGFYDNSTEEGPILSGAQERRICAELCVAGLGGEPCGESCRDITPQGLLPSSGSTTQSRSDNDGENDKYTRRSACPVLCANHLGWPLCNCDTTNWTQPFFKPDFVGICAFYCNSYNYQIYGCNECNTYKKLGVTSGIRTVSYEGPDWESICISLCQEGDGGTACYCDLLPMSFKINNLKT